MLLRRKGPLSLLVITGSLALLLAGGLAWSAGKDHAEPPIATPPKAKPSRTIPATDGLKACPGSGRLNFSHYYLGERFERLPLMAVLRNCDKPVKGEPYPGRTNVITFVYGDCEVPDTRDGGCFPPLEVTSAPACEDNLSLYFRYPDERGRPTEHRRLRIRSTKAASFDSGRQLEIYTADSTITIAGDDRRQVRRAARMLQSGPQGLRVALNTKPRVNSGVAQVRRTVAASARSQRPVARVTAQAPMPKPARGALSGKLDC